ncbi:ComEA family DNA-binding protein [Schaalia sp. ZJ1691]|uniref:ComEA family DNA-binding protein n=1 Tax=Schaalia sp. ZJ1691 TaxID=2709404 RepID=UPI0013ED200D|nr:ComEA family DNA-binding protein [Schaalia sp. ZJ1691]
MDSWQRATLKRMTREVFTDEDEGDDVVRTGLIRALPSSRMVIALVVLLVLVAGVSLWRMSARPVVHPEFDSASAHASTPAGAHNGQQRGPKGNGDQSGRAGHGQGHDSDRRASGDPGGTTPPNNGQKLVVHVAGEVAAPGVYELPETARVADAIKSAGGARPDAALTAINLARRIEDGEQIYVPNDQEAHALAGSQTGGVATDTPIRASPGASDGPGTQRGGCVNINAASVEQLQELDGVGPALAQRIVNFRKSNGRFTSVDQLDEVSGIGPAVLDKIRPEACI